MYGQVISSVPKKTAAGLVRLRPGAAYDDVSEILRPILTLANYLPPDAHYWESADKRNRLQMRLDKEGRIGSVGFEGELFLPRPIEGLSLGMSIAQSLKVHPDLREDWKNDEGKAELEKTLADGIKLVVRFQDELLTGLTLENMSARFAGEMEVPAPGEPGAPDREALSKIRPGFPYAEMKMILGCLWRPLEGASMSFVCFDKFRDGQAKESLILELDVSARVGAIQWGAPYVAEGIWSGMTEAVVLKVHPDLRAVASRDQHGWMRFEKTMHDGMRFEVLFRGATARQVIIRDPRAVYPETTSRPKYDLPKNSYEVVLYGAADLNRRSIKKQRAGLLHLSTGSIVACDALADPTHPAFARTAPPGDYPVYLYLDESETVGLAAIEFASGEGVRISAWEEALLPGQSLDQLGAGEYFGYPSDAGCGSFGDRQTWAYLSEEAHEELADAAVEKLNAVKLLDWHVSETTADNLILFESGYGDGFYSSHWGLDAAGRPVMLVTDFRVFVADDD